MVPRLQTRHFNLKKRMFFGYTVYTVAYSTVLRMREKRMREKRSYLSYIHTRVHNNRKQKGKENN